MSRFRFLAPPGMPPLGVNLMGPILCDDIDRGIFRRHSAKTGDIEEPSPRPGEGHGCNLLKHNGGFILAPFNPEFGPELFLRICGNAPRTSVEGFKAQ